MEDVEGERERENVQHILWFDNETPSCPYRARSRQSKILREREVFGWSGKV